MSGGGAGGPGPAGTDPATADAASGAAPAATADAASGAAPSPVAAAAGAPGSGARRPAPDSPKRSRGLTDLLALLVVYAAVALGAYVYARGVLSEAPSFPGAEERLPLLLLGVLPAGFLLVFAYRLRRLAAELRGRRYGSRLKARLVALFLVAVAASSIPQGVFLLRLARRAQSQAASADIRRGLEGGLRLVLAAYDEDLRRLEYAARNDLPALAPGRLPERPDRLLEALRAREPRMEAVELFERGASAAFAGDRAARLAEVPGAAASPAAAAPGPLPASQEGGVGRLRYLVPWGPSGAVVLTLRLPEGFDRTAGALARGKSQAELMAAFSPRWGRLLLLLYAYLVLPLLLLAALFGVAAAELVVEPLASLEEATRRVASGELSLRLLAKPGDETGRLVASFNAMLGGIERYREGDLRKGKIDAWKDIAQRLAHELKNPLTPIRLAAERLLRLAGKDPERALELIEPSALAIVAEVESMDALLSDFRSFAALPEPVRGWTELRGVVEEAVALYAASYPGLRFELAGLPEGILLLADRAQLKRALSNLLSNAVDAMEGSGRVEFAAELVKTAESRYCRLLVRDDGRGMPAEVLARIFAPYFTTKPAGTGLGLSIVERIVADHGGSIRAESEEGVGTSFYIDLPAAGP